MANEKKKAGRHLKYGEKVKNVQTKVPLSRIAEFIAYRDKYLAKLVVKKKSDK